MLRSQDRKWLSMLHQKRFQFQLCLCNHCPAWKHGVGFAQLNAAKKLMIQGPACGLSYLNWFSQYDLIISNLILIFNSCFQCFPLFQYRLRPLGTTEWYRVEHGNAGKAKETGSSRSRRSAVEVRIGHSGQGTGSWITSACQAVFSIQTWPFCMFSHKWFKPATRFNPTAFCAHCCNCCMSVQSATMNVPDLQNSSNNDILYALRIWF